MGQKTEQLQIRVTPAEKSQLRHLAAAQRMELSEFVLSRVLPNSQAKFLELLGRLDNSITSSHVLAELSDFLLSLTPAEFSRAVEDGGSISSSSPEVANYAAALVETAAVRKGCDAPGWVSRVATLAEPYYASSLLSLRLHLLVCSPPIFRRRNLFIDSSLGDRV